MPGGRDDQRTKGVVRADCTTGQDVEGAGVAK